MRQYLQGWRKLTIINIPISKIKFKQPLDSNRTGVSTEIYIPRLAEDIRHNGLREPVKVSLIDKDGRKTMKYTKDCQVIGHDGQHRVLAYKYLGLEEIPCEVAQNER